MRKIKIIVFGILVFILFTLGYMRYHRVSVSGLGLQVLSGVKKVRGQSVDLSFIGSKEIPIVNHNQWTELLNKHVGEGGIVNYQGFIDDVDKFNEYLNTLSHSPPGWNWSPKEQLAYWINAYNAFTIQLIIKHYPINSIKDISDGLPMIDSPWDIKFFKIGTVDFDLNTIEHDILRKRFDEPRIHFVINCASISCPNLRNEAYTAEKIELQLAEETMAFVNDPSKNNITSDQTQLSSIFNWFKSDFTRQGDLLSFIEKYSSKLNRANKIEYLEYDWNLNE